MSLRVCLTSNYTPAINKGESLSSRFFLILKDRLLTLDTLEKKFYGIAKANHMD